MMTDDVNGSPEGAAPSGVDARVRKAAGLEADEGPSDATIRDAVVGFAGQFAFWFTRVIAEAVGDYRKLVVRRVNVLVRPIEFDGLDAADVARRLVSDYVNRNFVTAGGWAIESMAVAIAGATGGRKSSSRGIDLESTDPNGNRHLYVIKSGTVTRNSDILSKLKEHARSAEKLIRQGGAKIGVFAHYAVATGATESSYEDGIYRPSSGEFWSGITGLPEPKALALISEIAKAAGRQVTRDTDPHIGALVTLVQAYISDPDAPDQVDWPFVFKLTMTKRETWAVEDKARHGHAIAALAATGYKLAPKERAKPRPKATGKLAQRGKSARGAKVK